MRVAGFEIENAWGNGVEGSIPLRGLTVLYGKNASGKTTFLESLASLLDPKSDWLGRRGRIGDHDEYAFGRVFLSGSWDGDDWQWLSALMADRAGDSGLEGEYRLPAWSWPNLDSRADLVRFAAEWFADEATPGSAEALEGALGQLTAGMLVTYAPWPYQVVGAVIDTATLPESTRALVLDASEKAGDSLLASRLHEIAESPRGYVSLMGLGALDESNFEDHALHPPTVINLSASAIDAEAILDRVLFSPRVTKSRDEGDALVSIGEGRYVSNPKVTEAVAQIQKILNRGPMPAFIVEQGMPEISVPTPELWSQHGRVVLGLRTPSRTFLDIRQTTSAVARWIQILVVLAVDEWLQMGMREDEAINWKSGVPVVTRAERRIKGRILLLDEPEVHLHPIAQDQVADWLVQTADSATTVLVATHSPAIVNTYTQSVTLVGVHRTANITTLEDISGDALKALENAAGSFGSGWASLFQVARGLVLVEGAHDVAVVTTFYGAELAALRAILIPIRGHKNLAGTVIAGFFGGMGVPIRVMFDDVRAEAVNGDDSIRPLTSEEDIVQQVIHLQRAYPQLDVVSYEDPDVICALPMTAVRRAWPAARIVEWSDIIDSWRSKTEPRPGFKPYALKRLALKVGADDFVKQVLASTVPGERPSIAFQTSMETLVASLR